MTLKKITAKDLEIVDADKYDYILTYSFPCQDLSLAGNMRGMKKGDGTRSGLLWEVERLLDEISEEKEEYPQILVMENVPQVMSSNNINDFHIWQIKLEELGYSNYVSLLNAKDYGAPQNRNRCFMISILNKYNYSFPKPFKLNLRLKDMLEENVDEKYYLSEKMVNFFKNNSIKNEEKGNGFRFKPSDGECVAKTITTKSGDRMDDNFILVPESSKKGYSIGKPGDGIYIDRPHQKRGVVQKAMIPTIKTSCNDIAVIENDLRIRKLTPIETWRLMGFDDEDFYKASKLNSNRQLYKQAGNSIVVDVLYYIFREFFI